MPMREFTDSSGVAWRVWNTRPSISLLYGEALREGWLTFESPTQRRRLAPIPEGWEEMSEERLEVISRGATEVSRRHLAGEEWSDTSSDSPSDRE
jgi:hypothetical protein